jgi:hypothetical protein
MIKFENTEVFNLDGAIRGMRNSWESWDKSDSKWSLDDAYEEVEFKVGYEDHKLAMKLSKAGSDHGKYLRQILISVDIIAPEKWWSEFDTYKVGTVANSTSMMHTLGKDYIPASAFSFEDLDDDILDAYIDLLNVAQKRWVNSGKKKPSREWRQMVFLTAVGFNYRRAVTANYQVLKNIYHSRKNHRLSEWHDFCKWIYELPYSELITLREPF